LHEIQQTVSTAQYRPYLRDWN